MENQNRPNQSSIGVVIPTLQAVKHLSYCLLPIIQSPLQPNVLVIDSSSTDGTVDLAKDLGAEVIVIPKKEFNHGTTRELGRKHLNTDIVVMVTQDAYPTSIHTLEELVRPILNQEASIAYGKQLPHEGADFFEAFPRSFNYPSTSQIRSIRDISIYGVYTFFCSNSWAAYLNSALDEIGGFPSVLFGEDTVVVAKLLQRNHKIAYVASAQVKHSHRYLLKQEFRRHFDIGLARHTNQDLLAIGGKDTQRGKDYAKTMFEQLRKHHAKLIPYAILQTAVKLLGYQLGKASVNAPIWFKKAFSSQEFYWR